MSTYCFSLWARAFLRPRPVDVYTGIQSWKQVLQALFHLDEKLHSLLEHYRMEDYICISYALASRPFNKGGSLMHVKCTDVYTRTRHKLAASLGDRKRERERFVGQALELQTAQRAFSIALSRDQWTPSLCRSYCQCFWYCNSVHSQRKTEQ